MSPLHQAMLGELVERYGIEQVEAFLAEVVRVARLTNAQHRIDGAFASILAMRGQKVKIGDLARVVTESALGLSEVLQAGVVPVPLPAAAEPPPRRPAGATRPRGRAPVPAEDIIDAEFEEV